MLFVYILLILILATLAFFLYRQNSSRISEDFFNKFNEKFPQILNQANTNLVNLANQKLGAEKQEITSDLANKRDSFEKILKTIKEELQKNQIKLEVAEKDRVGSFNELREAIENNRKMTQELSVTTEGLKKVLSNNQLRGAFGEKVAEDLLKMSGFVRGVQYDYNKASGESDTRPDFTIHLPDGTKINVDAKFPYSNLQKLTESNNAEQRKEQLRLFIQDVKNKIKQVTTRDYINLEDNTVDFVILFIPNEMIFSFIYDKMPEVWEEALSKKVIFAGPFSFTAILRMVYQSYQSFRYQQNVQAIIGHIRTFEEEFGKYNEEFKKFGDKIESLSKQYTQVSSVRTNKLLKVIDKIKLEPGPTPKLK